MLCATSLLLRNCVFPLLLYSGDITSAPEGASEFIDLEYKKARQFGRYVVISNTVYTGQNFCDIPEIPLAKIENSGYKGVGDVKFAEIILIGTCSDCDGHVN